MPRTIIEIDSDASGAEKGLKDTQQALDETGKAAKKTGDAFDNLAMAGDMMTKGITAPMLALGTAIGVVALKSASWADEMETMADKTGLSLGRLQELRYITSQTNTDFGAITQAAAQLGRRMVSGAEDSEKLGAIFDALGVKITGPTGKFREMDSVLPEVLSKLAGMEDKTLRNALAMELFGLGGKEMIPLLNAGGDTIARLTQKAHDLGLVMGTEDVTAMAAFSDRWDAIQQQLGMGANKINAELIPVLDGMAGVLQAKIVPWTERAAAAVHDAIQWWEGLDENTKRLIITMVTFGVSLGPVMSVVGRVPGLIKAVEMAFDLLMKKTNLVIMIVTLLASAWITNWNNIRERTQYAVDLIKFGFEQMGISVGTVWNNLKKTAYGAILGIMDAASPIVSILPKSISEGFEEMRAGLREKLGDIEQNLKSLAASGVESEQNLELAHIKLQAALNATANESDFAGEKMRLLGHQTAVTTDATDKSSAAFKYQAAAVKEAGDQWEAYRKKLKQVEEQGWGTASAIVAAAMAAGQPIPTGAGVSQWASMAPVFTWSSVPKTDAKGKPNPAYQPWMSSAPMFAEGGIVRSRPGGTLIRAAEGGEDEWFFPESKLRRLADALSGIFRVPALAPAGFMAAPTGLQGAPVFNIVITGNEIRDDYDVERIGSKLVGYLKARGVKAG